MKLHLSEQILQDLEHLHIIVDPQKEYTASEALGILDEIYDLDMACIKSEEPGDFVQNDYFFRIGQEISSQIMNGLRYSSSSKEDKISLKACL